MTTYEEIITRLNKTDQAEAERWEEQIDIITHKLKFLPTEAIPKVCIIDQGNNFRAIDSSQLKEKVKIAGGIPNDDLHENTEILIIRQRDESLYSLIPELIEQHQAVKAIVNNKIYIIQSELFEQTDASFLLDLEILAEIIQPKYFVFGRSGDHWIKFELV